MNKPTEKYKFFENKECEFYPCHPELDTINCLFCYCPGYWICSERKQDNKKCENCLEPHKIDGFNNMVNGLKKAIKTERELKEREIKRK